MVFNANARLTAHDMTDNDDGQRVHAQMLSYGFGSKRRILITIGQLSFTDPSSH